MLLLLVAKAFLDVWHALQTTSIVDRAARRAAA
jgi:hypothetical protein